MLKRQLENSISGHNPVVATSKSMHCLRLGFIEELVKIKELNDQLIDEKLDKLPQDLIDIHGAFHRKMIMTNTDYYDAYLKHQDEPEKLCTNLWSYHYDLERYGKYKTNYDMIKQLIKHEFYSKRIKHLETKVEKIQDILTMFKQKGRVIIDEADTILNCKNEVNSTMGELIYPSPAELSFLVDLHRKLMVSKNDNYTSFVIENLSCALPTVEKA